MKGILAAAAVMLALAAVVGTAQAQCPGPDNWPPVAVDDVFSVPAGEAAYLAVGENDFDPDFDTPAVTFVSAPTHGTAQVQGPVILYTPAAGYVGEDSFAYTITDWHDHQDTASVTVTVTLPRLLGWWSVPGEPGSGVSLDVRDGVMYTVWYGFDEQGRCDWLACWAEQTPNTTTFGGTLYAFTRLDVIPPTNTASCDIAYRTPKAPPAAQADNATVPGVPLAEERGTAVFSFESARRGLLRYTLSSGESGEKVLEKYLPTLLPDGAPDPREEIQGWFTDPADPGAGVFIEVFGETLFLGRYGYRKDGSSFWQVAGGYAHIGEFPPDGTAFSTDLMEYAGGAAWGTAYSPPAKLPTQTRATLTLPQDSGALELTIGGDDEASLALIPYRIQSFPHSN